MEIYGETSNVHYQVKAASLKVWLGLLEIPYDILEETELWRQ